MADRVTIGEAARRLSIHRSNVSRQATRWRLVGDDGLIDFEMLVAMRATESNRLVKTGDTGAMLREATNLKRLQSARLELRIGRERGELVRRADVVRALVTTGQRIRDAALAIPARAAQDLAGVTDPAEAKRILAEHMRGFLDGVANGLDEAAFAEDRDAAGEE